MFSRYFSFFCFALRTIKSKGNKWNSLEVMTSRGKRKGIKQKTSIYNMLFCDNEGKWMLYDIFGPFIKLVLVIIIACYHMTLFCTLEMAKYVTKFPLRTCTFY